MNNIPQSALQLMIHGQVQNVGFRRWAEAQARELGLTGWVRNNDDSTVEMLLCGPSTAVARMHQLCERGPVAANVMRVDPTLWTGEIPKDFRQIETGQAAAAA